MKSSGPSQHILWYFALTFPRENSKGEQSSCASGYMGLHIGSWNKQGTREMLSRTLVLSVDFVLV